MKLPRDVDARQLIKALARLGYRVTRQAGSHVRLACTEPEAHSITVPDHSPLKLGTFSAILADIAAHHRVDRARLIEILFS